MSVIERDRNVLRHMLEYCAQIEEAVALFGADRKRFAENTVYHNAVALCILQIGELTGVLSPEFRGQYPEIPWRDIKLMRNIVAHRYGTVDYGIVWEVVRNDVPVLAQFCRTVLEPEKRENAAPETGETD